MPSLRNYVEHSELALASYARLFRGISGDEFLGSLTSVAMPPAEATRFSEQWRVVVQESDVVTGLSATVFEEASGKRHLAVRGTDDGIDIVSDIVNVGLVGAPFLQPQYVLLRAKVQQWLADGTLPQTFSVAGHSLGGFLATGIAAEFAANIEHAYLYNAPGLGGVLGAGAEPILQALGIAAPVDPAKISNIKADAGVSPIAGFGVQVAPPVRIVIENQFLSDIADPPSTRNHSLQVLTDSLALYATLERLDSKLTADAIDQILRSSSNQNKLTLEAFLDALRFTLTGSSVTGTNPTVEGNREVFYQNLYSLQESAAYTTPGSTVTVHALSDHDAEAFADKAKHDFGYFLAVHRLLPVAIEGASATLATAHEQLFSLWLSDQTKRSIGATDLAFTDAYLADRAEMLAWKGIYFANDGNVALRDQRLETYTFIDRSIKDDTTGIDLTLTVRGTQDSAVSNPGKVIFGEDAAETLLGSDIAAGDRLYAGSGDDVLQGGRGNDDLEGGAGNDAYVWNSGDGFDTIFDTDGIGSLIVDGTVISGGIKVAQSEFLSTGKHTLRFEGDADSGGVLLVNGDLTIEGFTNGDLGIVLGETGSIGEIQPTTHFFHGPTFSGSVGFGTSESDHVVTDYLNSIFISKGGDDLMQVSDGTLGPRLAGGSGQDLLLGGHHEGSGELWGDAGQDIIIGGPLAERLVGDFEGFQFFDFEFRGSNFRYAEPSAEGSEHLVAPSGWFFSPHEAGVTDSTVIHFDEYLAALNYVLGTSPTSDLHSHYDDYLDGGDGSDVLLGGYGSDVLLGGAANDFLDADLISLRFELDSRDASWRETVARLFGQPGNDYLDGGDGNDQLTDRDGGNDVLLGGAGNDVILSAEPASADLSFSNHLEGGDGNDSLTSSNRSLNGHDVLVGGPGDDVLRIEFGSAHLEGGAGSDTYVVSNRFSPISLNPLPRSLVINDFDQASGSADRLHVTLMSPVSELSITRDEWNLYLGRSGDAHWITISDWFSGPEYRIESIVLDDGTTSGFDAAYDIAGIEALFATQTAGADFLWGTSAGDEFAGGQGDDTLYGNYGDDILAGNAGNDTFDGGEGGDTYVFQVGDGIDRITDTGRFGIDTIFFGPGITPDSLTLDLSSLLIRVGESNDAIHVENFDPENALGTGSIEMFRFTDGGHLKYEDLVARGFDLFGTQGDDTLRGTNVSDRFNGEAGSDSYVFGRESGRDEIHDLDIAGLDTDLVRVVGDIASSDIAVDRAGDYVTLSIVGDDDQLSILWKPDQGYQVERVEFPDGTSWDTAAIEAFTADSSNTPPTVAKPLIDKTVQMDWLFRFSVPEDAFSDTDTDDVLSLSATLANGDPLPEWLAFDALTGEFSGIPNHSDVGTVSIRVTATDREGATTSDEFALAITGADRARRRDFRKHFDGKRRSVNEAIEWVFDRNGQFGEALDVQQIAQRWHDLRRFAATLLSEHDQDAVGGAGLRIVGQGWFVEGGYDGGFGYDASTGRSRPLGNLQAFRGLNEGFHQL